eukprot:2710280-Amphidinium_carterae.1
MGDAATLLTARVVFHLDSQMSAIRFNRYFVKLVGGNDRLSLGIASGVVSCSVVATSNGLPPIDNDDGYGSDACCRRILAIHLRRLQKRLLRLWQNHFLSA